ncbi:MAG: hypothetical protein ACK5Q5_10870 [Planctomycetaceae bacterium]
MNRFLSWVFAIGLLGGTVAQAQLGNLPLKLESDHDFDNFISPMSNPFFFEDPRMLTEARIIFANHHLPNSLGGDNAQLYAAQVRVRLTENLSLIANKDGFLVSQSPILDDGWADVAAGLKLSLFTDPDSQFLLSTGFTFEFPSGQRRTLQGNGDGEFNLFLTGGAELFENVHWLSTGGVRLPTNRNQENQVAYWSNHIDKQFGDSGFYLFNEWNWYHWMRDAKAFPLPLGGLDIFNLGGVNMNNQNVVTTALGVKYKPSGNVEIGVYYEVPVSNNRDIIQDRIGADLILRY